MKSREEAPALVKIGLWGIKSRSAAMIYAGITLLFGIIGGMFMGSSIFFIGLGAAIWYAYTIWWMDRNSGWD